MKGNGKRLAGSGKEKREVVVVTGASAGLGRAVARAFARRGASIGLLARGKDGLDAARQEVELMGGKGVTCVVDVSDPDAVEAAAGEIEKRLGPITIWINNAMVSVFSPVRDMRAEEYRRVIEVNYLGYVHGSLAALKRMFPRDEGVIIQVGSALAYRGIPLQSAYCASKHAIQGFTDSLRTELMHDRSRVRVTMVQMPAMNTPQFRWVRSRLPLKAQPVPPIFQPEVAARAVVYAATHNRREIYVGLPTVKAVVGNKIAPGVLDRVLARNGFRSQQTDEPADPDRPDNLFAPLPGDHGAHGAFDERSKEYSIQLWANMHRGALGLGAALLAGVGLLALSSSKSSAL